MMNPQERIGELERGAAAFREAGDRLESLARRQQAVWDELAEGYHGGCESMLADRAQSYTGMAGRMRNTLDAQTEHTTRGIGQLKKIAGR